MKKICFALCLLFMMTVTVFVLSAKAEETASGTCGDSITWTLDSDGTLTVTGSGAMEDWTYGNQKWNSYMHDIKTVVIGEGVTHIGNSAFGSAINLSSVTLPSTLKSIGSGAFYYNTALTSIMLPDGLETIGKDAFYECTSLTEIIIPESVSSIGEAAFYECFDLVKAQLPDGLEVIEKSCFDGCNKLETVNIPTGVKSIKDLAFNNCFKLTSVDLPEGLEEIWEFAFNCVPITSLTLPSTLTMVGEYAFCATQISTVTIPETLTQMGKGVFARSWLVSVVLHGGMETIPNSFFNATGIVRMYIPGGITTIEEYAFKMCTSLSSVRIPLTVTSIENGAFSDCLVLKDVFYEGTEEEWSKIDIGNNNWNLTGATIHYNSLGKIDDPNNAADIVFHVGYAKPGKEDITLTIPWSIEAFLFDANTYHSELAIPCLALSGAVELKEDEKNPANGGKERAFAILKALGFKDEHFYGGYFNTDELMYDAAAVFAYQQFELEGKTKNVFVIVVKGTTTSTDVLIDVTSVFGSFGIVSDNMKERFKTFVKNQTGSTYEELCADNEDNILLVTGHSLGGAIANHLAVDLMDFAPKNKSFFYTFAAPYNFATLENENRSSFTNVHNIINYADKVPFVPPFYHRVGKDYYFNSRTSGKLQATFKRLTSGVEYWDKWKELPVGWVLTPHMVETYMSFLINDDGGGILDLHPITYAKIKCPVDVEVYDADGNLVGRIVNNTIDTSFPTNIGLATDGDTKYVILTEEGDYTFVLTGTDDGTMTYTIMTIDPNTDEVLKETVFQDVALTAGKTMVSELNTASEEELHLYVVNEDKEPIAEISPTGEETSLVEPEESSSEAEEASSEESSSEAQEETSFGESSSMPDKEDTVSQDPANEEKPSDDRDGSLKEDPLAQFFGTTFGKVLAYV